MARRVIAMFGTDFALRSVLLTLPSPAGRGNSDWARSAFRRFFRESRRSYSRATAKNSPSSSAVSMQLRMEAG